MDLNTIRVKRDVSAELIAELDRGIAAAHDAMQQYKGAAKALEGVEKVVNERAKQIKAAMVGENAVVDFSEPIKVAQFVMDQLMRIIAGIHENTIRNYDGVPISEGKRLGLEAIKKHHAKVIAECEARLADAEKREAAGEIKIENGFVIPLQAELDPDGAPLPLQMQAEPDDDKEEPTKPAKAPKKPAKKRKIKAKKKAATEPPGGPDA